MRRINFKCWVFAVGFCLVFCDGGAQDVSQPCALAGWKSSCICSRNRCKHGALEQLLRDWRSVLLALISIEWILEESSLLWTIGHYFRGSESWIAKSHSALAIWFRRSDWDRRRWSCWWGWQICHIAGNRAANILAYDRLRRGNCARDRNGVYCTIWQFCFLCLQALDLEVELQFVWLWDGLS